MDMVRSRILIFGASGYLGKYMVRASMAMRHPTLVVVRPIDASAPPSKLEVIEEFESMGVKVFQVCFSNQLNKAGNLTYVFV